MSVPAVLRLIIAALATIGGLLMLVPHPYWGVLLLATKAGASIGVAALTIRACVRRRH
jgi:hypothetical protein